MKKIVKKSKQFCIPFGGVLIVPASSKQIAIKKQVNKKTWREIEDYIERKTGLRVDAFSQHLNEIFED